MADAFVDRLTPILTEGDLVAAWELLYSLEGDELKDARDWFARGRRWLGRLHELTFAGDDHDARFETAGRADWIVAMCAVRLCGPATAAKRVPWTHCWDFRNNPGEAAFIQLLWDTDRGWVADFVEAASHVSLGGNARNTNGQLSRALRAAAVSHQLPCPTGRTFLAEWWAGTGRHESLAARLAADPFMPDLLFLYLASGNCGDLPDLPAAIAELCASGIVERDQVLAHVLDLLTASQKPTSQKVLAQITAALDLKSQEIPGGLTYLLGVLSTSHRTVIQPLLSHAIDLIVDADGLLQLTNVLTARPEKQPKVTLLAALKTPTLPAAVGTKAALEALSLLGAGDDAAFTDKVNRVAATLGATDSTTAPGSTPTMGLWDLEPSPNGGGRTRNGWPYRDPTWDEVLDSKFSHRKTLQPWLVDITLAAMASGTFRDGQPMREAAGALLARQRLLLSSLSSVLDDLFLGGGLRQAWPVALEIADAACGAPSRPTGIADLLRTLARYAVEVPRPCAVPPHIAALAASESRTKAQVEARRLAAVLADEDVDTVLARLRGTAPAPPQLERRGLWELPPPPMDPLPSLRRLTAPTDPVLDRARDLGRLRDMLSENYNGYAQSYEDICYWPRGYEPSRSFTSLTNPDRVVAATVAAIRLHGADAVRTALAGIERKYGPVDVVAAIDVWIAGTLDVAAFWRVAQRPAVSLHVLRQEWAAGGVHPKEIHERVNALPPFSERLTQPDHPDVDALVLPFELGSAVELLAFLRAGEALLRAEHHATILSTPTWADGTLDLDDLLARLADSIAAPEPTVGPIDLVQALHRLRPVDPARADDVPAGLRTDAAFTDPDGVASWDATELVRTWISAGGLPPLDPRPDENGMWSTRVVAPVPFNRLAALPKALADDPWAPGPIAPTVRMMPRWGDRVVAQAFAQFMLYGPTHFPGHIAGAFGVPLHDRLLSFLTPDANTNSMQGLPTLVEFAQRGRVDATAFAAAAVGRHERGTLRLSLLTKTLQRGFEENGAFPGLWPAALAMADTLCGVTKKPSGLPELLRLLTTYAHEVPASEISEIPDGLRQLAEGRGSTRSHAEARELVAALHRAQQTGGL